MTTWSKRERTVTTVEFGIPVPANMDDFDEVRQRAEQDFKNRNGRPVRNGNDIKFAVGDDEVVIYYVVEEVRHA